MSFKTYPESPLFKSEGEKAVYGYLIDQLSDDASVYCNVEHFDGVERREIDFLVSIPNLGLVALEVKGGKVVVENNTWMQWSIADHKVIPKNFSHQLDAERRMLRDRFRQKFSPPYPSVAFLLVTPDSDFSADAITPGIDRWQLVARNDLENLYSKMRTGLGKVQTNRNFGYFEQESIRKMFGDEVEPYAQMVATAGQRGAMVDELSRDQLGLLDLMAENNRIFIKGGPGSGKTVLAIEQAMRLAATGKRVGLICYNRGLGKYLSHSVSQMSAEKKPFFVGTLWEDLAAFWGIPQSLSEPDVSGVSVGSRAADYYENILPNAILNHTSTLQDHQKFDAWVVDESQDLKAQHWGLLQASLRDPDAGIIHVFGDENQNLFDGAIAPPWFHAVGRLNRNLRSSRAIATALNDLTGGQSEVSGLIQGVSPEILLVESSELADSAADEYVKFLIDSVGWKPQDIVVMTTKKRHARHLAQVNDPTKYWDEFLAQTDVFYTHVLSFKGLERPVVVIAVNGIPKGSDARQRLYVAMSRARDDLVLVGMESDLAALGELFLQFPKIDFGAN